VLEPRFDEHDLPTDDEVCTETATQLRRDVIEYHALTDADYTSKWMVYPVNSPQRQAVAERIARYFHREAGFDHPPYSAGDETPDRPVYLVRSERLSTMVPLIAGAVAFRRVEDAWVLSWVWLHPWERSGELTHLTFNTLDQIHGPFLVAGPVRKAMRGLMDKRGYREVRIR